MLSVCAGTREEVDPETKQCLRDMRATSMLLNS